MPPEEFKPEPAPAQPTAYTPPAADAPTAAYAPAATDMPDPAPAHKPETNAGLIVLQWLTYAFWGWTVLALSVLTTTVISSFIADSDTGGFMPYGIAAVLVLLPISYVCDSFYSKHEPAKKQGAEIWVMVFHAVIFALFAIGALISAVISVVLLITSSSDTTGALVALVSSLIIAAYYALTFLRTLNPAATRWLQKSYKMMMIVSVGVIALLGIVGPMAKERATQGDRLVVAELPALSTAIENYAQKHQELPADLAQLDLRGDTQKLVDKNLVEYKAESEASAPSAGSSSGVRVTGPTAYLDDTSAEFPIYRYQLCTTYTAESDDYAPYSSDSRLDDDGYADYLSVYSHPAGKICYKLKINGQ